MRLRRQYLARNDCYQRGVTIRPMGVMVHSTGANNPRVARYVPGDAELGQLPPPAWSAGELTQAVELGVTDGTRPLDLVTRAEAAVMAVRAGR